MSNPNANLRICDARSTFVIQMQTFSDRAHAVVQQRLPPAHYSPHTPLVIDNGSFEFRAGWSSDQTPRIVHRNLVGVPRVKRHPNEDYVIVGDPILERESNRINTRSPFDRNVVYQSDLMEHVLDHAFAVCGVRGDTVQHPIVMTEALCNPNHCRGLMSELLFECYQVPSVCYGVDALFSYHYNVSTGHVPSPRQGPISAAVLVSSGWQATHIVPLIDGRAVMDHAFRLDVGGFHAHELMTKTMQLKYPHHKNSFTSMRSFELLERFSRVSQDYLGDLDMMSDFFLPAHARRNPIAAAEAEAKHCHIFQLPFTAQRAKASEQLSTVNKEASKLAQAQRMRELQNRQRLKKLEEKRATLDHFLALQTARDCGELSETAFLRQLRDSDFDDQSDFDRYLTELTQQVDTLEAKCRGEQPVTTEPEHDSRPIEEIFPLLNVPDKQLDTTQRKLKRIQQMQSARVQKRRHDAALAAVETQKRAELQARFDSDPAAVLAELREQKHQISEKRARRQRDAKAAGERGSSAFRKRMRIVASLAGSEHGNARARRMEQKRDSLFGDAANDWDDYRRTNAEEAGESDSETEKSELNRIETLLAELDPSSVASKVTQLTELDFQVTACVELIRAREILFQPSLIGNNSAGLPELTNHVLNSLPAEVAQQMSNNVFVCGGHAVNTVADGSFGLKTRLYQELRQCRPADQTVCVYQASDSRHDAWRGAGLFARNAMNSNDFSAFVTRQQYDECGRHYLSEHHCSNWNSV